jgi:hypothetical protein
MFEDGRQSTQLPNGGKMQTVKHSRLECAQYECASLSWRKGWIVAKANESAVLCAQPHNLRIDLH